MFKVGDKVVLARPGTHTEYRRAATWGVGTIVAGRPGKADSFSEKDIISVQYGHPAPLLEAYADRFDLVAHAEEEETVAKRKVCPSCDQTKLIEEGDYLCNTCREGATGSFRVMIPEIELKAMSHKQLINLLPILVSHGIGFTVVPPEG